MNILIIGGSRFFGKKLTLLLVKEGHKVTLITRSKLDDILENQVKHIRCDRSNHKKLEESVRGMHWDVIYDQVCYTYDDAKSACDIFETKTSHYIFTSSKSVYKAGKYIKESDFDPSEHHFEKRVTSKEDYAEAKRQAEVAFNKHATFKVTSVRFPIVVGLDDYTERLNFHLDRIKNNRPIYFPNLEANISFITSDFASEVLAFLKNHQVNGAINAASNAPIKLKEFILIIERFYNNKLVLAKVASTENHSPYGISEDWFLDCSKLKELGLEASEVKSWFPKMLNTL